MIKILKKTKYILTIILFILISIYIYNLKQVLKSNKYSEINSMQEEIIKEEPEMETEEEKKKTTIHVDIKGAIKNPMVYELNSGSRVIDLIETAGGLLENADTSLINLSKILSDEMVVYIYTKEEVKNSNIVDTVIKVVEKECVCPNIQNDGCINTEIDDSITNSLNKLININTASLEELMTLPGIGEQKAKSIIDYRNNNGNFNDISDITKVSGIGNSLYETIKEYITT